MAEVGLVLGAVSGSLRYISHNGLLFQKAHTLLSQQNRRANLSTQRRQKPDIPVSSRWVMFSKTTRNITV